MMRLISRDFQVHAARKDNPLDSLHGVYRPLLEPVEESVKNP